MRNSNFYTARRRENFSTNAGRRNSGLATGRRSGAMSTEWTLGRNTVRHTPRTLGTMSLSAIMGMLVLVVGLIYVTQGTRAAGMDYELSSIENEITELTERAEDLAVEKARMTAIAAAETTTVEGMEAAVISGYAGE